VGTIGVVPAAGRATRLQPLRGSKEVVVVRGRPVMDFLLERMWAGGATEIRVVTRPDKQDVVEHARLCGAALILARPASVSESVLAGMQGLAADDVVLFGFPDTIWEPVDGFLPLVRSVQEGHPVALGLFLGREPQRSDVVTVDDRALVRTIDVKPERPRSHWVWGCAAARAGTLRGLESYAEPGDYFGELAGRGDVAGVRLSETFIDVGTPDALERLTRPRRSAEDR
jgi:glucose-1-phosphate thymidylyltransferase